MSRLDEIRERDKLWRVPEGSGFIFPPAAAEQWAKDTLTDRRWLLEQVDRLREALRLAHPLHADALRGLHCDRAGH